uniref:Sodium channel modifier 1 (Predicted) n=1 Tax=Rhinolophus ferrumequinum TaxID=59479 RepID=B2KI59_RHIFE|nr:sodium channel modifier 1 (predicted) [Rhinolophus ferrumequinum]
MSFKREGDDWSQLNVLKKRRVGDLLASYIPEDEALMLRDGRFACAICPHRPVLDTLAMLTAHRAGKKHLSSLQLFYGKKQPGKGMEQNPRPQNELEREETKAEVIGERSVCSRQDLRLEGLWLLGRSSDSVLISMPGSSVNPDAAYHPERFAQSSSLQQLLPPEVQTRSLSSLCLPPPFATPRGGTPKWADQ